MTYKKLAAHLGCWILFIAYEVGISVYLGDQSPFFEFGVFYILDILLFYFNAHAVFFLLTPATSFSKVTFLLGAILMELLIYTYFSIIIKNSFSQIQGISIFFLKDFSVVVLAIWRGVYFLGLSIAYWAVLRTIKAVKNAQESTLKELKSLHQKKQLENEIIKLQNAYLHARINPHFLFNTLNFIYSQIEEGNPDSSKNILLLSEIMWYSLCTVETDGKVPLSNEIEHIRRYVTLNKSRFDNKLYLNDQIAKVSEEIGRIPPLLLLTFVENVFKHGDMIHEANPGIIRVCFKDGTLILFTKNKKNKSSTSSKGGHGIANAMTRMDNYFNRKDVDLNIQETHTEFTLILKIRICN